MVAATLSRIGAGRDDHQDGATVVELLVVMLVMSIIGSLITVSLVTGMRGVAATQQRYDGLAELQLAVDRMARELRAADPVEFSASSPTKAVVTIYRDAPAFADPWRYTYLYCAPSGATPGRVHVRQETAPPATIPAMDCPSAHPIIIDDVDNGATPVFSFLTAEGAAATTGEDVFRMALTLKRAVPGDSISVSTSVRVRNAR